MPLLSKSLNVAKSNKRSFAILPISWTTHEQELINKLVIQRNGIPGPIFGSLQNSKDFKPIYDQFYHIGNSKKLSGELTTLVKELIFTVVKHAKKDSFMVFIRASFPNKHFDIPRWHQDGHYFGKVTHAKKFVTVLRGRGTLFHKANKSFRKYYNTTRNESNNYGDNLDYRKQLQNKIGNNYIEVKPNHAALFTVADPEKGAFHSEPPQTTRRLFISILPCTQEQMKTRRNSQKHNR